MSQFIVDERIESTAIYLADWPLSRVFLKNEAQYPWLVLVPRVVGVEEIHDLSQTQQQQFIAEITKLSSWVKAYFKPDKINTAALGNIVNQLHVHVVARFKDDALWPQSIWQASYQPIAYEKNTLKKISEVFALFFKNNP